MSKIFCLTFFLLLAGATPAFASCAPDVVNDLKLIESAEIEDLMIDAQGIKNIRPMPYREGGSHQMHIADYQGKIVALKEDKPRTTTLMTIPGGLKRRVNFMLWESIYLKILSDREFGLHFYGIANINGTLHLVMDYLPNSHIALGHLKSNFSITYPRFIQFERKLEAINSYFTALGVRLVDFQFLVSPEMLAVIDPVQFDIGSDAARFNRDIIDFKLNLLRSRISAN